MQFAFSEVGLRAYKVEILNTVKKAGCASNNRERKEWAKGGLKISRFTHQDYTNCSTVALTLM